MEIMLINFIRWVDKKEGSFAAAQVYSPITEIIHFNKIPKGKFELVENIMEGILEHEILHIVIGKEINYATSAMWDNIFPTVASFKEWIEIE